MKLTRIVPFCWWSLATALLATVASCTQEVATPSARDHNVDYYTCSMHPSVHSHDARGKCPICNMSLIPVYNKTGTNEPATAPSESPKAKSPNAAGPGPGVAKGQPAEFTVPIERQQQIGVTYAVITNKPLRQIIRAVGRVAYDPQRHWNIVSRVQGYVLQLRVSSPGDLVEKGQPLLTLYSPDLLTTQRELVDLLRMRDEARTNGTPSLLASAEQLIASAERRLSQWNLTRKQIAALEQTRQPQENMTLESPVRGVVHHLHVDQGQNVNPGDVLIDVADLSVVWVWAEFYQEELAWLKKGAPVSVIASSDPNERFRGEVAAIDLFLDDAKRTGRVRLDIANPDFKLRPDMYVNAELELDAGSKLAVPVAAVLPTGLHNIVFVDKGGGRLEARFIELGRKFGDDYAVNAGLEAGENVVNSANFLIDAESKIQGALKSW